VTRDDMRRMIAGNDWTDAARALAAVWHYVESLERDGCWERAGE